MHTNSNEESDNATLASVKKEMAKPRIAKSARTTELNLDAARIPEQPAHHAGNGTQNHSFTSEPIGKGITVDSANHQRRDLFSAVSRLLGIENTLTDEHGDDVKLKKGGHVEVPVTADPKKIQRHH